MAEFEIGTFDFVLLAVMSALSVDLLFTSGIVCALARIRRLMMIVWRTLLRNCSDRWKEKVMAKCSVELLKPVLMVPLRLAFALSPVVAGACLVDGNRWYKVLLRPDALTVITVSALAWWMLKHYSKNGCHA